MNRFKSLSYKIIGIFILISIGTILLAGWVINFYLKRNFEDYLYDAELQKHRQIAEKLQQQFQQTGNLNSTLMAFTHIGDLQRTRIQIYSLDDRPVYDSGFHPMRGMMGAPGMGRMIGQTGRSRNGLQRLAKEISSEYPLEYDGKQVGTVVLSSYSPAFFDPGAIKFKDTVNKSFIITAVIAIILTLILTSLVAPSLIKPLQKIRDGALIMKEGNWSHRINYRAENELGAVAESLNLLAAEVERLERVRKKVTANVAHELRNPLMTLQSYIEGMQDGVISKNQQNLEILHEEVMRLNRFVEDLKKLTSVDRDIHNMKRENLNLFAIAKQRAENYRNLFRQKEISLEVNCNGANPIIYGNQQALETIIDNLLNNSLKYTPEGGRVEIEVHSTQGKIRLHLRDTGRGIPEKDLPFIFERFYRVDQEGEGGAGIGLAIVKELVLALQGEIKVNSREGQGTEFILSFPPAEKAQNN